MGLIGKIVDGLGKLLGGVDELVTSDEERLRVKQQIAETIAPLLSSAQEYEVRLLEAKSRLIEAEMKSDSFLAKNWRPFTMIVLACYIVVSTIVGADIPERMWDVFYLGFGGYIIGRSVEKTAGKVAETAMQAKAGK